MPGPEAQRVLITGATGFIGRHLHPALVAAGAEVRAATRDLARARRMRPDWDWVHFDADDPSTFAAALEGCDALVYLVHSMAAGPGYDERERAAADAMREAARRAGVRRIVYVGGVAPAGRASKHLRSRLETGERLRADGAPTIELRAGMVIGAGSTSWQIVRDLAARLPAMLLPQWLGNRSSPVFIDDVVLAIVTALYDDAVKPGWYEVPGPEAIRHRELLDRVADMMGRRPAMLSVPVLTPRLSSYWLALVTRADLAVAKELVLGLQYDLLPHGPSIWDVASHPACPTALADAVKSALDDEETLESSAFARIVERIEHHRVGAAGASLPKPGTALSTEAQPTGRLQ